MMAPDYKGAVRASTHLVRRFFWSLSGAEPDRAEEQWLVAKLSDREAHLYRMMSNQDRRHAIECGREADRLLAERSLAAANTEQAIVASALHDVGKTPARLGTVGRAFATVLKPAMRYDDKWIATTHIFGRMRKYTEHAAIGADQLRGAGSTQLVVAWAAEHHLPVNEWTIDRELGLVLAEADGEPRHEVVPT